MPTDFEFVIVDSLKIVDSLCQTDESSLLRFHCSLRNKKPNQTFDYLPSFKFDQGKLHPIFETVQV